MKIVLCDYGLQLSFLGAMELLDKGNITALEAAKEWDGYYQKFKDMISRHYFIGNHVRRDDQDLISLMSNPDRNFDYLISTAKPRIVYIPDDVEWEIHETEDGKEFIAEKHRTWR